MESTVLDIDKGAEVFSADGKRLGTVAEVWAATSAGLLEKSASSLSAEAPISGQSQLLETSDGYLRVADGGVLGIAEKNLFVPLSQVVAADRDGGVRLACDAETCERTFMTQPDLLRGA